MTSLGFLLVLAAAACHAVWNFFVKQINAGPELVWLFSLLTIVIYSPLAAWFLWQGPALDPTALGFIFASCLIHLGYFLLLQQGYRKGELSIVYPTARATGPMLSTLFSIAFLNDHASLQGVAGGLVIIFGVFMLSGGIGTMKGNAAQSLRFGIGAGLMIGSYTVWDAYTVSVLMVPPLLLDYASSLGRVMLLAPIAAKRKTDVKRLWREHKGPVFVIALFNPLAYILVLVAMTFTPVSYVAPIREISVVLSVLLGSLVLGEGQLGRRLALALVILAGVSVLATS